MGKAARKRTISFSRERFPGFQFFTQMPGISCPGLWSRSATGFSLFIHTVHSVWKGVFVNTVSIGTSGDSNRFLTRNTVRLALAFSLALFAVGQAAAQYPSGGGTGGGGTGGGPTYTAPAGGYSSAAKGAGIGAGAAAGVGALFLAMHYHGRVTGCVQPGDDGLRLVDEKNKKTYALVPGDTYLKPGERVLLKGKTSKSDSGTQTFTAKKLIKDLGSCGASPSASSPSASQ